jgi:hypothetical protein
MMENLTRSQDKIDEIVAKLHLLLSACSSHEEKCPAALGAYFVIRDCLDQLAQLRGIIADKNI